jgi:hypothetical protein
MLNSGTARRFDPRRQGPRSHAAFPPQALGYHQRLGDRGMLARSPTPKRLGAKSPERFMVKSRHTLWRRSPRAQPLQVLEVAYVDHGLILIAGCPQLQAP